MKKYVLIALTIVLSLVLLFLFFSMPDVSESNNLGDTFSSKSDALKIGDTFSVPGDSGNLNVSIIDAQIYECLPDAEPDSGFFLEHTFVAVENGTDTQAYSYPDFLKENNQFVEGVYLIVIDLHVVNEDAKSELYDNPYEFRADSLITLVNLDDKDGDNFRYKNAVYYCGQFDGTYHTTSFELSPGETTTFSIGFLINDSWENVLQQLRASTGASTKSTLIDLALGDNTDEE